MNVGAWWERAKSAGRFWWSSPALSAGTRYKAAFMTPTMAVLAIIALVVGHPDTALVLGALAILFGVYLIASRE